MYITVYNGVIFAYYYIMLYILTIIK